MAGSRTATFLFTDLVGSTALSTAMAPEQADALRRAHFDLLRTAVNATEGTEVKSLGDGLMVVFASASLALECAAAMQQAVDRHNRRHGMSLGLRIGISMGEATEEDGDFFGDSVVEAARLCAAAEGGQVLTTETLCAVIRRHVGQPMRSIGALQLKGLPDPVPTVELIWEPSNDRAELPSRLVVERLQPMVGREVQLARLLDVVKRADLDGTRMAALVSGEPGIGKTRLAAEAAGTAAPDAAFVLHGACYEDLVAPYSPWTQVLEQLMVTVSTSLRDHLDRHASVLLRAFPSLAAHLADAPVSPPADPATEKLRIAQAVDDLLSGLALAERRPVLVVIDDLHWADEASLAVFSYLCRSLRPAPVVIIGTYRDTDLSRRHPLAGVLADLRRTTAVERIHLTGLEPEGITRLVETQAGQEADVALVEVLCSETEGNPFFVLEVLRHLAEAGAYVREDGRWVAAVDIRNYGIPEGVREAIGRRLSRLPAGADTVLAVGATMGREFEGRLLQHVMDTRPAEDVLDALEAALRAGLILEEPTRPDWYSFSHALVRQTLIEELSVSRRTRLHWRIADEVAALHPDWLDVIAFHRCEGVLAGEVDVAVATANRAGHAALERFAFEEAGLQFDRALAASDAGEADPTLCFDALFGRGVTAIHNLDTPHAVEWLVAAAELARRHDWPEKVCQAVFFCCRVTDIGVLPQDPMRRLLDYVGKLTLGERDRVEYLIAEHNVAFAAVDFRRARQLAEEALSIARRLGDPPILVEAITIYERAVGGAIGQAGMASLAEEVAAVSDNPAATGLSGYLLAAEAALFRLSSAFQRGDRETFDKELALADRQFSGTQRWYLGHWAENIAVMEGRWSDRLAILEDNVRRFPGFNIAAIRRANAEAEKLDVEGDPRCIETLDRVAAQFGSAARAVRINASRGLILAGRQEEAEERVLDMLDALDAIGPFTGTAVALGRAAEVTARLHRPDLAELIAPQLERYAGEYLFGWGTCSTAADLARAQVRLAMGQLDEAVELARAAVELDEHFGAPVYAVFSQYWLAVALTQRGGAGDNEEARRLLLGVIEEAKRLDCGLAVREGRHLLERRSH